MLHARIVSQWQLFVAALTLVVGALLCCLLIPPVSAFQPIRTVALAFWAAGTAVGA